MLRTITSSADFWRLITVETCIVLLTYLQDIFTFILQLSTSYLNKICVFVLFLYSWSMNVLAFSLLLLFLLTAVHIYKSSGTSCLMLTLDTITSNFSPLVDTVQLLSMVIKCWLHTVQLLHCCYLYWTCWTYCTAQIKRIALSHFVVLICFLLYYYPQLLFWYCLHHVYCLV